MVIEIVFVKVAGCQGAGEAVQVGEEKAVWLTIVVPR
jgi:hypothetical protein